MPKPLSSQKQPRMELYCLSNVSLWIKTSELCMLGQPFRLQLDHRLWLQNSPNAVNGIPTDFKSCSVAAVEPFLLYSEKKEKKKKIVGPSPQFVVAWGSQISKGNYTICAALVT